MDAGQRRDQGQAEHPGRPAERTRPLGRSRRVAHLIKTAGYKPYNSTTLIENGLGPGQASRKLPRCGLRTTSHFRGCSERKVTLWPASFGDSSALNPLRNRATPGREHARKSQDIHTSALYATFKHNARTESGAHETGPAGLGFQGLPGNPRCAGVTRAPPPRQFAKCCHRAATQCTTPGTWQDEHE